ncbi:MAG: hypothetical protein N5P05_003651 [Chroococcopsis gigantea SAG 12.99]|jgi:Uma2 family endonuclease|nr:hypothetical protein [Chroococcopsis gigantea SAG 12.99]
MFSINLEIPDNWKLTDERFEQLSSLNRDLKFELTREGQLVIMPPTGGETGNRNFELYLDLGNWNRRYGLGKAFDSSTGFQLPDGSKRSPDVSWITLPRWNSLSLEQRKKFLPLCPDFVVELVSENDSVENTRLKMQEYIDNGCRLGWLIIPATKTVEIYRQDRSSEILSSPLSLSGEDVLSEFTLNLETIWAQ